MIRSALILLIRFYQIAISSFLPPACRFYPSCSEYTLGCLRKYGVIRGLWMGCKRIFRCHSLFPGGFDPVP